MQNDSAILHPNLVVMQEKLKVIMDRQRLSSKNTYYQEEGEEESATEEVLLSHRDQNFHSQGEMNQIHEVRSPTSEMSND
jgi:hypothetical protein